MATKHLVHSVAQNEVKIEGDRVTKTKHYKGSKPYHMGEFINGLFSKFLPQLRKASNYPSLAAELRKGLEMLDREVNEENKTE